MRESRFQAQLLEEIRFLFPGCLILKNDSAYRQGIPDWLILYKDKWAGLEVKASSGAGHQPNQDYYIDIMDKMSFAAFICPTNRKEVLDALQLAFGTVGSSRVSQR